jgi:hypothetical protein
MLGIEHPILLAPMGSAAGGRLATAVTHAGGFGMIGSGYASTKAIKEELAEPATRGSASASPWALGATRRAGRGTRSAAGCGDAVLRPDRVHRPHLGGRLTGCRHWSRPARVSQAQSKSTVAQTVRAGGSGGASEGINVSKNATPSPTSGCTIKPQSDGSRFSDGQCDYSACSPTSGRSDRYHRRLQVDRLTSTAPLCYLPRGCFTASRATLADLSTPRR